MARLIDADELITTIQGTASEVAKTAPYDAEWFSRMADRTFEILGMIDRMPTADAVPVVRCKDCKWGCSPYGDEDDGWTACANIHGRPIFRDEHFCSSGERRTDVQVTD